MNSYKIAIVTTATALTAALLLAQGNQNLDEKAKAAKAKQIAEAFENNARTLTLFDRDGKDVGTVGPRDIYNQPVLSPDRTRIATIKVNLDQETQDLWVMDIATGKSTQITHGQAREGTLGPAWSPDSNQVAYISLRNGSQGVYRSPSSGEGPEELLYRAPGQINLTDWSQDGRYICVFSSQLGGSSIYVIPTEGKGERNAIEVLKSTFTLSGPRLSPDSRFISYMSNQSGKNEMYISRFDVSGARAAGPDSGQRQISDQGGQGMGFWRRDGKQFYYLANDRGFMAVEISTNPALEFGKPKLLFHPAPGIVVAPGTTNVSRDGERFLIAAPPPQLRQLTILDRQGKVVSKVGEPGEYGGLSLSHDGTRVALGRNDPKTGNQDVWVYDLSTGKGTAITSDNWPHNSPVWSSDDKQVAYVSSHDNQKHWGIYRKSSNGTGSEELLFQYTPGAFVSLSDWSADDKFLTFATGVMLIVPLDQGGAVGENRKAIEWLREEYSDFDGHFSPDSRWFAYASDELGVNQAGVYVRRFDAAKPEAPGPGPAVEITGGKGAKGMIKWRRDGKELYYLDTDDNVTAVEITTTPSFKAGTPKVLFKRPGTQSGGIGEGDRFVFLIPVGASR
jgi:Tol biopolymer transport system component